MSDRQPPSAGVIGWPIAHSKSPLIHRFWLTKLGLDGDYGRLPVEPAFLGDALRALPALGLRGVNVTVPHKVEAMRYLDRIDAVADRIGAVNTVVVEDWQLTGYNTDATGFVEPLRPYLDAQCAVLPKNAHPYRFAHLVGCGGAAKAIAAALAEHGFTLILYNRDPERARTQLGQYVWDDDLNLNLRALSAGDRGSWPESPDTSRVDLLVNATTLGMRGQPPLDVDFDALPPGLIVYDIVYAPLDTPLLTAARARGLRAIDGLAMLIGQAAVAFEKFYSRAAPREHDADLRALLTA